MKLRGKQKRYLRSRGNQMRPLFSIGKMGIDDHWITEIKKALDRRELIKIKVLANSSVSVSDAAKFIESHSSIQVVQKIGKTLLLFSVAKNPKKRRISNVVKNI